MHTLTQVAATQLTSSNVEGNEQHTCCTEVVPSVPDWHISHVVLTAKLLHSYFCALQSEHIVLIKYMLRRFCEKLSLSLSSGSAVNHGLIFAALSVHKAFSPFGCMGHIALGSLPRIIYIFNGWWPKCSSITSNENLAGNVSSCRPSLSLCKYFFFVSSISLVRLCRHSLPRGFQWLTFSAAGLELGDKDCMTITWNVLRGRLRLDARSVFGHTWNQWTSFDPVDCRAAGSAPGICRWHNSLADVTSESFIILQFNHSWRISKLAQARPVS